MDIERVPFGFLIARRMSKLPSPNDTCRIRQAIMHNILVETGAFIQVLSIQFAMMVNWSGEPVLLTMRKRWT